MACRRGGCAMVKLDQGRVLVAGGFDGSCKLKSTEVLDIEGMRFAPGPTMLQPRSGMAASPSSMPLMFVVAGGVDEGPDGYHDTAEWLDLEDMTFKQGPSM